MEVTTREISSSAASLDCRNPHVFVVVTRAFISFILNLLFKNDSPDEYYAGCLYIVDM
jgi:hypothetical protein